MGIAERTIWVLTGLAGISAIAALVKASIWPISVAAELLLPAALLMAIAFLIATSTGQRWAAYASLGVFAACALAPIISIGAAPVPVTQTADAEIVRLAHANLFESDSAARRFAEWARQSGADIVSVTEPPREGVLRERFSDYELFVVNDDIGRRKVLILSKLAIEARPSPDANMIFAIAKLRGGKEIALIGAHPPIPITPSRQARRDSIVTAAFATGGATVMPTVIVGDFNSTPWAGLLQSCAKKHNFRRAGGGLRPTWLAPIPGFGLTLDHFYISRGIAVRKIAFGPYIGSDHWPIMAELEI